MVIQDYVQAQGAADAAKRYRVGIARLQGLASQDTIAEMEGEAGRLESEVLEWCAAQECPSEAEALAHRRFWELDTQGRLLKPAVV